MDPDTRFTDEEMQKILARAARHQERVESSPESGQTGFSLARLQEVAADVGISPAHVKPPRTKCCCTVRRRRRPRSPAARAADGADRPRHHQRRAVGEAGAEFRRIFKQSGIPSQFGEVREWVSSSDTAESLPVACA